MTETEEPAALAELNALLTEAPPLPDGYDPAVALESCRECPRRMPSNLYVRKVGLKVHQEEQRANRSLYMRPCTLGGTCGEHADAGDCPLGRMPHQVARKMAEVAAQKAAERAAKEPPKLEDYFGRVYVINLRRKPERLKRFWDDFPTDWPFPRPERWDATDGHNRGGGAWGCRMSWLGVLDRVIADGVDKPILVLEDDCKFVGDVRKRFTELLHGLPDDWELAAPGVHHIGGRGQQVSPGVVSCQSWDRTHSVMIHPRYFVALREFWRSWNTHVDHGINKLAREGGRKFYAADPVFAIQADGWSDVSGKFEPVRTWDGRVKVETRKPDDVPVVLLRCSREVINQLRTRGFIHGGYWRDEQDRDRGLCDIVLADASKHAKRLKDWISMIRIEAAAFPYASCAIWHSEISRELMKEAWPDAKVIEAETAQEAEFYLQTSTQIPPPIASDANPCVTLVTNFYKDSNRARSAELAECLSLNLANPLLTRVVAICDEKVSTPAHEKLHVVKLVDRPTFDDYIRIVNELSGPDDINIIANSDIYFDESVAPLAAHLKHHEAVGLTRWDRKLDGQLSLPPYSHTSTQDAWVVRGPFRPMERANFCMGKPGCDHRFAAILKHVYAEVFNPYEDVKAIHLHSSNVRHYRHGADDVRGEFAFIDHRLITASPPDPSLDGIISMSLFGSDEKYFAGAMENARLAKSIYPRWRLRFYVEQDYSLDRVRSLRDQGAEVVRMFQPEQRWQGLFWRFLVADDYRFARWMVRDADSRFTLREKAAVDAWISSGQPFHIIRDHPHHTRPIMGCAFGGTRASLPRMQDMVWRRIWADKAKKYGDDETFLAEDVYPLLKGKVLIHDTFGVGPEQKCNPLPLTLAENPAFVGERFDAGGSPNKDDRAHFIKALETTRWKHVVSFSLFGSSPRYLAGAIPNVELARVHYPGWICRFYVSKDVPRELLKPLRERGAEVVEMDEPTPDREGCFWRYLVACDPTVERWIVRDVDSRIGLREKTAVAEWIESGKGFHAMRDNPNHGRFILGGMWGGSGTALRGIAEMMKAWPDHSGYGKNEEFLNQKIWPMIEHDTLQHDSSPKREYGSTIRRFAVEDGSHVGQIVVPSKKEMAVIQS